MLTFTQQFLAARGASTPLVDVRTFDPAATISTIMESLNGSRTPILSYDFIRGMRGCNDKGSDMLAALFADGPDPKELTTVAENLQIIDARADRLQDAVIFFHNAHRYLSDAGVIQAVWNLRDVFKTTRSMLVMLTTSGAVLPPELTEDVTILDHPLPNRQELVTLLDVTYQSYADTLKSKKRSVPKWDKEKTADALAGLSAYSAEQNFSMCLDLEGKNSPNLDALWERKRKTIEQTPGLSVWRGTEKFDDLGGLDNIKNFLRRVIASQRLSPRCFLFIDEVEKAVAGAGSDLSGTKTDMLGTLLSWFENRKAKGALLFGVPGTGKSAIAKAAGNEANVPTIVFDFAGMQASLVGESGARLRAALGVVDAVAEGQVFVLATCNSMQALPPELRRRFKQGIFFYDLPTDDERKPIWKIYRAKYEIDAKDKAPGDDGWTGAEIEQNCLLANSLGVTLAEAAQYVVPVSISAREQIELIRQQAAGRFISASRPGIYQPQRVKVQVPGERRFITMSAKGGTA